MPPFGKLAETVGSHTEREWMDLVIAYRWRCFYCARPVAKNSLDPERELTKDHLSPIARGGVDFIWNIVVACFACNRLKGNKTSDEFRAERLAFSTVVGKTDDNSTGRYLLREGTKAFFVTDFCHQATTQLSLKRRIEPSESPFANDSERRKLLRQQAADLTRLRLEASGQLRLPLLEAGKPVQSESIHILATVDVCR